MSLGPIPSSLSNLACGIEGFNRSVGFVEDLRSLFNQRLNVPNKFFLIELVVPLIRFCPFKVLVLLAPNTKSQYLGNHVGDGLDSI